MHANEIDRSKRAFILVRGSGRPEPVRPPWTDDVRIVSGCTRCGDCVSACPEGVLKTGDGGFPEFDPQSGAGMCTFCGACAEACEAGVFDITRSPPWSLSVRISTSECLAHAGVHCSSCRESCDHGAIRMRPRVGGPPLPEIVDAKCTGCGACLSVCPSVAVTLFQILPEETTA